MFWCEHWICSTDKHSLTSVPISFPELRSPWPAVGKRELWEQPFQACAIAWNWCRLKLRSELDNQNLVISHCYFKMDAPRTLVFRPLVKGNEALGTRLVLFGNVARLNLQFDVLDLNTGLALVVKTLPDGTFSSIWVNRDGIRTLFRFVNTLVRFRVDFVSWTLDLLLSNIQYPSIFEL